MPITAFVSHSYRDYDKEIVDSLLNYLDTIKDAISEFSYRTAKRSQPVEVHDKVNSIFSECNMLIALCLKQEAVIEESFLKSLLFVKNRRLLDISNIEYKTSDWIIQEIGFAIGKDMPIILLLENGLRPPGQMQGNLEYIAFDRNNISGCFDRLLQMISSKNQEYFPIQTNALVTSTQSFSDSSSKQSSDTFLIDEDTDSSYNYNDFTLAEYKEALRYSHIVNDQSRISEIVSSFNLSEISLRENDKIDFQAFNLFLHATKDQTAISNLLEMHKSYPNHFEINAYLGFINERLSEHYLAAVCFEKAASNTIIPLQKIKYYGLAAVNYLKSDKPDIGSNLLEESRSFVLADDENESFVKFLHSVSKFALERKSNDIYVSLCEQILFHSPYDVETRFELAHKYYELNLYELSYYHYNKLLFNQPWDSTLNNIGLVAQELGLSSLSVKFFKEAIKDDYTLSMSNLANQLIQGGFLEEAREYCDEAIKNTDCHQNIYETLRNLSDKEKKDESNEKSHLQRAEEHKKIFLIISNQFLAQPMKNQTGRWDFTKYVLDIQVEYPKFEGFASYEESPLMSLYFSSSGASKRTRYTVSYKGEVSGCAISFNATINEVGSKENKPYKSFWGFIVQTEDGKILLIDRSVKELKTVEIKVL